MFSTSSSLAASSGMNRHSSGLLKNTFDRMSKQHLHEKRMFGSRMGKHGKDFKIGKKFKKVGKGIMKGSVSSSPHGGISPSVEEFDELVSKATSGNTIKGKKKTMFSRKQFG